MALLFLSLRAACLEVTIYTTFDTLRIAVKGSEDFVTFTALHVIRELAEERGFG
jgi:hypothetical protein